MASSLAPWLPSSFPNTLTEKTFVILQKRIVLDSLGRALGAQSAAAALFFVALVRKIEANSFQLIIVL